MNHKEVTMMRSAGLRWVGVLVLLLTLSSLACITAEIGVQVAHIDEEQGQMTVQLGMHLTDAYMQAARSANAERAQDYQAAGLEVPEQLFPETFNEMGDMGLSPDEFMEGGEAEIVEQTDSGYTIVGSKAFDENLGLDDESAGGFDLAVDRTDPERVRYIITMEVEDMSSDMDLADLDQLRAEGLGPKPPIETAETAEEPGESEAEDLGTFIVEGVLEEMFGAVAETGVELDAWYAERVLLEAGLPTMTYWIELPGEIVSHELNGQPTGTLNPAKNRVTLVIDENYMRQHPEGTAGVWRIESVIHTCEEECSTEPHMIWDQVSGPEECICECESGWTLNEAGDACVEEEEKREPPPHFIGNPANLEALLRARGYSELHCPAGEAYPEGAVILWNRGGGVAHSSVMTEKNRQIEMGHKPGGKKYVSEHLEPNIYPKPNKGIYAVTRVLCRPPGARFDSAGAATMAGLDRNYREGQPNEWNCHGFSANVITQYARTGIDIKPGSQYRWEGNRLILEGGEVHLRGNDEVQVEVINGKVIHHSEFLVVARADGTAQIAVLSGEVIFEGTGGSITLGPDEMSEIDAAGTPSAPQSFARNKLEAWWVSEEMVELREPEPSLADFRAFESGEVEELEVEEGGTEFGGIRIPTAVIAICAGALALGVLLLVIVGLVVWRRAKRRKRQPVAPSVPPPPRPVMSPFAQAERRLGELQAAYQAGRLDRATFQAEVQKLVIQDERGQHWALGGEGGVWYWYDGSTWVRRDPPR
jgi:hypothetical protein